MRKYLLISHGKMAQGVSESLKMFLGENHAFKYICAYVEHCDPQKEIQKFFSKVEEQDEVVVCTDLLGGSVNQFMIPYLKRENTYIIAGFNLPLLMELSFLSEPMQKKELRLVIEKAQNAIVLVNDYDFEHIRNEGDE